MTPYISQISIFGFTFPPEGWALCNGDLVDVSQQSTLFALIGNRFGGNGTSNFALPDFRGRVPLCQGRYYYARLGQMGGEEMVQLDVQDMPAHDHDIYAVHIDDTSTNTNEPAGKVLATSPSGKEIYNTLDDSTIKYMSAEAVSASGSDQAHPNVQPSLVLNFCIALDGIFPSRN